MLLHESTVETAIWCYYQYMRIGKEIMAEWELDFLARHGITATLVDGEITWAGEVLAPYKHKGAANEHL